MENMNIEPKIIAHSSPPPEEKGRGFTMFLVFAVIALIVAGVAIWFSLQSNMSKLSQEANKNTAQTNMPTVSVQQTQQQQARTEQPDVPVAQSGGSMRLQSLDGSVGQVGKPIALAVIANSSGKDIVGFDIVLDYNPEQFELQSAEANAGGFKVSSSTKKGILAVSGYKLIGEKNQTVFSNTQIATITLVPKQTGSFKISPVATMGTATSKMISVNKEIAIPELESVNVVISN